MKKHIGLSVLLFLLYLSPSLVGYGFAGDDVSAAYSARNIYKPTTKGPIPASAQKGAKLFTQFSLFEEDGVHRTTNYRKGILIPVNTLFTLVEIDDEEIVLKSANGKELVLVNVEPFSGEAVAGIYERTLGVRPLDLSAFTDAERKAIAYGAVEVGMSKEAVVVALGYPPKHRTPSLTDNQWRYWQNRFNTFLVIFEANKVKLIRD